MADSQNQIDILLKAVLDAKGFEELKVNLSKASAETKEASGGADKFGASLKSMGAELLAVAGIAAGVAEGFAFLKDSFHAAVEEEAGAFRLKAGLQAVAGANKEATDKAAEFIDALESQAGIADDELRPALVRLAAATHDTEQAQNLLKIAADAANAGVGDFSTNVEKLTMFIEKGKVRGFDPMSIALNELSGKSVPEVNRGLAAMASRYADLAEKNNTMEFQLRKQGIAWENTKEAVGSLFASMMSGLAPALEFAAKGIAMVVGGTKLLVVALENAVLWIGYTVDALAWLASGKVSKAREAMQEAARKTSEAWEKTSEEVTASLEKIDAAFHPQAAATGTQIKVTPGHGDGKKKDDGLKELEHGYDSLKKSADAAKKAAEELAEAQKKGAATAKEIGNSIQKEKDRQEKADLRLAKAQAKTKADALRLERNYWRDKLGAARKGTAEYTEIMASYVDAQHQLDAEEARSKEELARKKWDTARNGVAAMSAQFRGNKEIAIAGVAMDTYAAAQSAYKAMAPIYPSPLWGVIAAATAIADGAQNMAGVRKAEPGGGGFDIPEHDMMAYMGGRRWADDMVRNFTQGVSGGWKDGMAKGGGITNNQSITNNNQRTTQVHITGLGVRGGDDAAMRKDARRLQTYLNQLESERTTK